jgi:hypothetical protein
MPTCKLTDWSAGCPLKDFESCCTLTAGAAKDASKALSVADRIAVFCPMERHSVGWMSFSNIYAMGYHPTFM